MKFYMKRKIVIYLLLFVVVIFSVVCWKFYVSGNDNSKEKDLEISDSTRIDYENLKNAKIIDGTKVNNSKKIKEKHYGIYDYNATISSLLITDATISSDSEKDVSYFRAVAENVGNEVINTDWLMISLYDEYGEYVCSLDYYLPEKGIEPNEKINIEVYDLFDFINVYDYTIRIWLNSKDFP